MLPKLIRAHHAGGYIIELHYADGVVGQVDFAQELEGEIFEPLRDLGIFRRFTVRTDVGTVEWENGADFAPEFLYEAARQAAR